MGFHKFSDLPKEFVTPQHSTAFGELLTGQSIEVGRLHFKEGEGAHEHAHPQEQIMYVVSGALRVNLEGQTTILHAGDAFHATPMVPHTVTAV